MTYDKIISAYHKVLLHAVRVISVLIIAVGALTAFIAALDVAFDLGFGYPWWSFLGCAAIALIAFAFWRFASWQLRQMADGKKLFFDVGRWK